MIGAHARILEWQMANGKWQMANGKWQLLIEKDN